jgi:hypothetical protein
MSTPITTPNQPTKEEEQQQQQAQVKPEVLEDTPLAVQKRREKEQADLAAKAAQANKK